MKNSIILGIKGFIIGIANIIPGVSGGTLAITLGIYERLINTISHFFKNIVENIKFLIPIGIGAVLSLAILSNVIGYSMEHYRIPTTLFFAGLIIGGIPLLLKKIKGHTKSITNWSIFLLMLAFVLSFTFIKSGDNLVSFANMNLFDYGLLFIVGIVASATMIIPGISGSFVLMLLGYYEPIINTVRSLTHFENIGNNLLILIPFGIGILAGAVVIAKLIEFLIKKYETQTYFGIIGFVIASVISIIVSMGITTNILHIILGVVLFLIGAAIAYKLGEE